MVGLPTRLLCGMLSKCVSSWSGGPGLQDLQVIRASWEPNGIFSGFSRFHTRAGVFVRSHRVS